MADEQIKPTLIDITTNLDNQDTQQSVQPNFPTQQPFDNPLTRIPADIEQRVGAEKSYTEMSIQELHKERRRLSMSQDPENFWNRRLAGDKLTEAIVNRRKQNMDLLRARLEVEAVPESMIRVYRGEDEEGLGQYSTREPVAGKSGKWFSTSLDTAAAYAGNKGEKGRVRYMDIPHSDFISLNQSSQTADKRDIQIPVGYDTHMGSKILMADGSIPPEPLKKADDPPSKNQEMSIDSKKHVETVIPSDTPPIPPPPVKETLISRVTKLFSNFKLGK